MLKPRTSVCFLFSSLLSIPLVAQQAGALLERAPAGVEEVLRDRVTRFYGMHSEGKFRQAEAFVCEESKDAYYDSDKRRWQSLEIIKTNFSEEFTKAAVVVALGSELRTRTGNIPAKYPYTSMWKVVNGAWCHYIPPPNETETVTPFGVMRQQKNAGAGQASQPMAASQRTSAAAVFASVKLSKERLLLKGYEASSDELEIYNGMPGLLFVQIQCAELPGFTWKLGKTKLEAGERTKLRVEYTPRDKSPKPSFELRVLAEPLGHAFPVKIVFDIPEETKKQLPPALRP
ncbi:MAG: hypothetical protein HY858_07555 [Candidatus Solibacter usitatus]|nr:hypothetical protein [Candidatus Solibacter usitatus]